MRSRDEGRRLGWGMQNDASGNRRETPLVHYWNVLRKRRATVFGFTAVLVLTVLVVSLTSTRYYAATATIEIQPKAPVVLDVEKVSEVVPTTYGQVANYYETQYKIIKSRTVLQEAVRRLKEEHGVDDFDGAADPAAALGATLTVAPEPDTHLVQLTVEYPDPDKAALIANVIGRTYMDTNLDRSLEASKQALQWLSEQQEVYRQRKYASDERVEKYKSEHDLQAPEDKNITVETLTKLQEAWSDAHARRVTAEARQSELRRIEKSGGWLGLANHLSTSDPVLQGMLGRHEELLQEKSRLASRYKDDHPEMQQANSEIAGLEQQIRDRVDHIIDGQQAELKLVQNEEERLSQELDKTRDEMSNLGQDLIQLKFLTNEADRDELFFKNLDQRMTEVGLSQFMQANNIRFVDEAQPNSSPVRPTVLLNLLSAVVVGLMGGCALAYVLEYVDGSVKSREDVESVAGVPFLGVVPLIEKTALAALTQEIDKSIFVYAMPRSTTAECLRTIRTNLMFRAGRRPLRRLLVTSAAPQEGKSFISANLAAIIAMTGSRVLAIDGDLRRPMLHRRYQLQNDVGLADVLRGAVSLEDAVQPTHVPGLHVLVAGQSPANPSELLGLGRMQALMDAIEGYDLVLIDSPPVNVVSDALVLASLADGVVFVIESNRTSKSAVATCCERLREVNPNLLGAVVNKLDVKIAGYEYSYYYDAYDSYYTNADAAEAVDADVG